MIVNIYKRSETNGQFSYIAVPEGKLIPEEVTSTEWEIVKKIEFDDDTESLKDFLIDNPIEQITSKGYAITSSKKLVEMETIIS